MKRALNLEVGRVWGACPMPLRAFDWVRAVR
jgi:hypothetical protein